MKLLASLLVPFRYEIRGTDKTRYIFAFSRRAAYKKVLGSVLGSYVL